MKTNILTVMKNAFGGSYNTVTNRNGWLPFVSEPFSGAWQRNIEARTEDMLGYPAVFACITLIANDISKLNLNLVKLDEHGIWVPTSSPAYDPVLRNPNRYQNSIQFFQSWVLSLLINGNTYVLKVRDNRNVVVGLYVLDPLRVFPLIASDGSIWYEVPADELTNVAEPLRIPASEIIHDRVNPFYHQLVGVSPLYAAALSVVQGREIQKNSATFFQNNARPGGILYAPGSVSDEMVREIREHWETNYTGNNAGKVAVLADGLEYKAFDVHNAQNSQVIDQLKWSSEVVCAVFHVPPYKIGVGQAPTSGNVQSENVRYFSEALQIIIETIQRLIADGLGMANNLSVRFDTGGLLKMDNKTLMETQEIGVGGGFLAPNEARRNLNLAPVKGGESPLAQQQNFSLEALSKRDAKDDPFATNSSTNNNSNQNTNDEDDEIDEEVVERFSTELRIKTAERFIYAK